MRINLASSQNMFGPQMQNTIQRMGQVQNAGLQKMIQQINANYGSKKNRDTVELSKTALELLEASKTEKADEAKKPEAASDFRSTHPECLPKRNGRNSRFWRKEMEYRLFPM